MKFPLLAAVGAILIGATPAHSALLVAWDFGTENGSAATFTATTVDSSVTASNLSRGADFTPANVIFNQGRGAFATESGNNRADLSAALTNGSYATFTVAPTVGSTLSIQSIDVATFTQNAGTIRFEVVFSQNNFASFTSAGIVNPVSSTWDGVNTNFDLSGFSLLQETTEITEFRIAYYNGGSFEQRGLGQVAGSNNDIAINGSVSVIPEPASVALVGLGSLLAMIRRRR